LDARVQSRADELALVARGAGGVEGGGEHEGCGAEGPVELVPRLDHERQPAPRGDEVAAEGRLEAGLPVLPRVDALAEDDDDLGVDRVDHAREGAAEAFACLAVAIAGAGVAAPGGLPQACGRPAWADPAALAGCANECVIHAVSLEAA